MSKQTPLSGPEWHGVYASIRDMFHLKAKQRDQLDASPLYYRAMAFALSAREAANRSDYDAVEVAWRAVDQTLRQILGAAPIADPITGHVIELERRDPSDPNCFPCCGGLKLTGSHTSRCRAV